MDFSWNDELFSSINYISTLNDNNINRNETYICVLNLTNKIEIF